MWVGFLVDRLALACIVLVLVLGLVSRTTRKQVAALGLAACVHVGLLVVTTYAALPNLMDRTLLPAVCPLILMLSVASVGLAKVRWAGRSALMVVIAVWSCGWGWTVWNGEPRRAPNVAAYQFVREHAVPGDYVFSAPAWLEDLSVYRLGALIRGEQFLSTGHPVYGGSPARHQMATRLPDPGWQGRLAKSADQVRDRPDASLWVVSFGSAGRDIQDELTASGLRPLDGWRPAEAKGIHVVRYRAAAP
jgi:hypothetical protein